VPSPSVSRFHCEIAFVNGRWELNDLNSKKGTLLNGERIGGRYTLHAGDIVRLSMTVFRFDFVDESAKSDEAILAIKEAELDLRLLKKGEHSASLDEIRARSRLESKDLQEDRLRHEVQLKTNAAFLAAVTLVVALVVWATLNRAYRPEREDTAARDALEAEAQQLYDAAQARFSDDPVAALAQLRDVQVKFPGTKASADGQTAWAEHVWAQFEKGLARATEHEAESDFAQAMAIYRDLERLGLPGLARNTLNERKGLTVRLANILYKSTLAEAQKKIKENDLAGALELFRGIRNRLGVDELVKKADDHILGLEQRGL
jgi:hypothetical protein